MDALRRAKQSMKSHAQDFLPPTAAHLVYSFVSHDGLPFLHGHLHVEVRSGRNLPDMESWISKLYDKGDVTDPYVDIRIGKARLAKTSIVNNSLDPVWDESFRIELCHSGKHLIFEVRDKDHACAEFIGSVKIDSEQLKTEKLIEGWFPIKGRSGSHKGQLNLRVCYVSAKSQSKTGYEVDDVYFEAKHGCDVKLYMDSHVYRDMPQFRNLFYPETEVKYEASSCWNDMYDSIMGAREIICITGWSVWDKLQMFRGEDQSNIEGRNLGDILEEKADSGVSVYIMIWSEKTSGNVIGEKGIMNTHDMQTYNRFKKTKVVCALTPREIQCAEFTDFLQNEFASGAYTHHQKNVIVDAPIEKNPNRLRLVAYVGGLDLTGGRWDTPDFPLFSTLLNEHYGDFRNSNAPTVSSEQGPREPWHDIHSRVEGEAAYDVFINFYERWCKQASAKYGPFPPLNLDRFDIKASAGGIQGDNIREGGNWSAQLFRSITSDSAVMNPERTNLLNSKKGRLVDASISRAYVEAIRNADHFIYIENQYFLGSAYSWLNHNDVNCHHIIPVEITQKIVDKIYANERFTAYIVIPMFPEGDPASVCIQEILYWQYLTIEMMYRRIGNALQATKQTESAHPTDYLVFLCPAKRESASQKCLEMLEEPSEPMSQLLRQTMRFPIYVHSKMMIVDDAYIIVGSANINQRSMSGTRDTEIAIGLWQPLKGNRGEVHMFRMALWASHFKTVDAKQNEIFRDPSQRECVKQVKDMAYYNWTQYLGPIGSITPGQMVCYPFKVTVDGKLDTLPDVPTFPDFGPLAKIFGCKSKLIPQKVTT